MPISTLGSKSRVDACFLEEYGTNSTEGARAGDCLCVSKVLGVFDMTKPREWLPPRSKNVGKTALPTFRGGSVSGGGWTPKEDLLSSSALKKAASMDSAQKEASQE